MEETINYQDYIEREFLWCGEVLVCKAIYELDKGEPLVLDNTGDLKYFSVIDKWIKKTYL